ncbi:MAG: DUF5336 domain-containing protein [Mycobacteriales bacterium]
MSGYSPPDAQGQQGAYQAPQQAPGRSAPSAGGSALPLFEIIGAALGVLTWIWGFLNWFDGIKGFSGFGAGVIALALAASVVGAAGLLVRSEHKAAATLQAYMAAGLAAGAVLISFGMMVGHGDQVPGTKIGLILALITTILQAGAFTAAFLEKKGVIPSLAGMGGAKPQQQYPGYPQQGHQQPGGYQAPQQQGGYQAPQPGGQQPGGYQAPQPPASGQQGYQGYQPPPQNPSGGPQGAEGYQPPAGDQQGGQNQ